MVAESTSRRLTLKKILYHPLTWAALVVHVVLLVVPFESGEPEAVEESTEQSEAVESIPVDILNLTEIATSEPLPEPPAATPPPSAPAIAPPRPAPVPAEPVPPTTALEVQPEVVPAEVPAQTPPLEETPVPAYDPSADQQVFIQNLDSIGLEGYGEGLLPSARDFRKGTDSSYFINESVVDGITDVQPVAKARDARRLDKEPAVILTELRETYATVGLSFAENGEYGGETLYQLTKEDGSVIMHLSLVQLQGSTLLVIWQADPRL